MARKKISFIIPVYNGERYLQRCIESILNQNFSIDDIEILILDDGSSDSSYDIAAKYKKLFPATIQIDKHENMGVANTRNKGLKSVVGEYFAFIDQDDYIDEDFCSTLYTAAIDGDYDVVFSGMKRPNKDGHVISKDTYKDTVFARLMCMSVWAKLHRTSFVRENNIQLFNNKQGEDISFTFEEYQKTDKIKAYLTAGITGSITRRVSQIPAREN